MKNGRKTSRMVEKIQEQFKLQPNDILKGNPNLLNFIMITLEWCLRRAHNISP